MNIITKYLCLHLCALCIAASSLYAANNKPNVILIVCDDLNTDIEGYGGHPQAKIFRF